MVSAGDFKNGITLEMDGNIWQIIEFQHMAAHVLRMSQLI